MSRFKSNLEAVDVRKWTTYKDRIAEISEEELQNNDAAKAELERLRQISETVAATIDSVQPFAEFISPDIQNYVNNFDQHLNTLEKAHPNQKPAHLKNLNNVATSILELIWPYVSQSDAARTAGQAFIRYRKLIEVEEANISDIRSEANEALSEIRSANTDILDYCVKLLDGTDESASIKEQIEEKLSKIDKMLEKTEEFYHRLTEGDSDSASIEYLIVQAQKSAAENSSKIADKLSEAENKLKELNQTYNEVVGVAADGDEHKQGLKDQLKDRQKELDSMIENFDKKFTILADQIEDLLPGATSAGLATAYRQLRTNAETRTKLYSSAFFCMIGILTVIAAATITQSVSILPPSWEAITFSDTTEYFTKLLFKLPIIIPVLWAALTVSKRRSEMHRLAEEYAHKEALAKSYEGFKKQIIELGKKDNELLAELLTAMLKAISLNAAKTLDGKHGEKMPIQEIFEEGMQRTVNQKIPS